MRFDPLFFWYNIRMGQYKVPSGWSPQGQYIVGPCAADLLLFGRVTKKRIGLENANEAKKNRFFFKTFVC
jgi:hypothetical protein